MRAQPAMQGCSCITACDRGTEQLQTHRSRLALASSTAAFLISPSATRLTRSESSPTTAWANGGSGAVTPPSSIARVRLPMVKRNSSRQKPPGLGLACSGRYQEWKVQFIGEQQDLAVAWPSWVAGQLAEPESAAGNGQGAREAHKPLGSRR